MASRYRLTTLGMVIMTLQLDSGTFLSVKEIIHKAQEHFDLKLAYDAVFYALKQYQDASGNLLETKTERRTLRRIPTKLYSFPKINTIIT